MAGGSNSTDLCNTSFKYLTWQLVGATNAKAVFDHAVISQTCFNGKNDGVRDFSRCFKSKEI